MEVVRITEEAGCMDPHIVGSLLKEDSLNKRRKTHVKRFNLWRALCELSPRYGVVCAGLLAMKGEMKNYASQGCNGVGVVLINPLSEKNSPSLRQVDFPHMFLNADWLILVIIFLILNDEGSFL